MYRRKGEGMSLFKGSGVAIVTPFTDDNQVNYDKLGELLDWHVAEGTDAIILWEQLEKLQHLTMKNIKL